MMNIQDEIHMTLQEIQRKLSEGNQLTEKELETLFLTSLIEDEA